MDHALQQLSESVFLVEDTCNVYLLRDGDAGLIVDSGSGAVGKLLGEAGVESLEWILHTHHHRDQCWGTPGLVDRHAARVAVPEHERYLFESAGEHWRTKRIFDNYSDGSTFLAPGAEIAVDAQLEDYEEFRWRGLSFEVLPAQGHTFGSSALLANLDGRRVAFTGDLLFAGGRLYQLHAMEHQYGDMTGVLYTLQSLQALRSREPDLLLPSHGPPIEKVAEELAGLEERLMDVVRLGSRVQAAGAFSDAEVPATRYLPDPRLLRLSEHLLWSGPWACANFYVLLSGSGEALLVDYGHAYYANMRVWSDLQPFEGMRFVEHHLDELKEEHGVERIEAVIATHIHDDHTCGIPYLQRHLGAECWALDEVAKVLERPADWAGLPCVYRTPIPVARTLHHGERVEWRGFELNFHHAPGQTEFHSVVSARIDGRLVAFTGDNYFLQDVEIDGRIEQRPLQTTVFRNSFQLAMHRRCVEVMRAIEPDVICPGHGDVLPCDRGALDQYADFVAAKEETFRALVAEPADHYIDLSWARLRPYLATVEPGGTVSYVLMLRNNLERDAEYAARLHGPPGWKQDGGLVRTSLGPGGGGELSLVLSAPADAGAGRVLVTAEVFIDGRSQGPIVEALVTVSTRDSCPR